MDVKMARHILKLRSLNTFHNNSKNNNKITLTCVLTTIYLEDPVNKQAACNLHTCCVPEVILEAGYLKFSKSLTNHVLLSRLVTNPGFLNIYWTSIWLQDCWTRELWILGTEWRTMPCRRQDERREDMQRKKSSILPH